MIAVKIQCNCGQKYAFDVEPIGNSLPAPVACPVCGADGTGMANQFIAQRLTMPASPALPVNAAAAVRVAAPAQAVAAAVRVAAPAQNGPPSGPPTAPPTVAPVRAASYSPPTPRLPGQDPERAKGEARSKILWGDDPKQVIMFLRGNGYSPQEATEIVNEFVAERVKTVRAEGLAKVIRGGALMFVPVFALIGFLKYRFFPVQVLGVAMMIGCYGFYLLIKGLFMMIAPKSEGGDVADQ
jgi:hypothetical protein